MSNTSLSQTEADKLFAQINGAMSADDNTKLTELTTAPEVELEPEVEQVQEEPEKETPSEEQENTSSEDTTTQDGKEAKESDTPSEGTPPAESVEKEQTKEPTELELLKDQLAKLKKENHGLKSQAGRVPSVQRQVTELTKKLEELQNASTPSNLPSSKLTPALKEKLKEIEKTDPALAQAIIDSVAAASDAVASDNIARNRDVLTAIRDTAVEEQKSVQMGILLEDYPNALEIFKSDGWKAWKQEQSENVQRLAASGFAKDVGLAFELYARDMIAKHPELAPKETPAANPQAAKVEEARQNRQAASVQVTTKAAPAKVKMPDDPELLFKQAWAEIEKQQSGQ